MKYAASGWPSHRVGRNRVFDLDAPEMLLTWTNCTGDASSALKELNLDHEHFKSLEGVYVNRRQSWARMQFATNGVVISSRRC